LAGSGTWFLYNNTADTNYLGTGTTLINTTTYDGMSKLQVEGGTSLIQSSADTNVDTRVVAMFGHNSTGTAAAGFGFTTRFMAESSTTNNTIQSEIVNSWVIATDASRTARVVYNVYDLAARECLRMQASGAAPMIGFLGAPAVIRPIGTTDLRIALINLGLYATGGASPLDLAGGALTAAAGTFTGLVQTVLSAVGGAGFNLPHGVAPTAPVNGDLWTTAAGVFARVSGATVTLGAAGGSISGSIATDQMAYGTGANTIGGAATFLFNGTYASMTGAISTSTYFALAAGTAGVSSLRISPGVAPTAPVNGDTWATAFGVFVAIAGSVQPLNDSLVTSAYQSGNYTITIVDNYIEYTGNGGNTFTMPLANLVTTHSQRYMIKNSGPGTLDIACVGGDTCEGSTVIQLLTGQSRVLIANKVSSWSVN